MAYNIFSQPRGPEINISLFGDAAAQGAALGKAIPSPMASAVEGVFSGVERGQKIQAQDIANQNNQAVADMNQAKAQYADEAAALEIQRQKELLRKQQLENEVTALQTRIQEENETTLLESARLKAEQDLTTLQKKKRIGEILAGNDLSAKLRLGLDPDLGYIFNSDKEYEGIKASLYKQGIELPENNGGYDEKERAILRSTILGTGVSLKEALAAEVKAANKFRDLITTENTLAMALDNTRNLLTSGGKATDERVVQATLFSPMVKQVPYTSIVNRDTGEVIVEPDTPVKYALKYTDGSGNSRIILDGLSDSNVNKYLEARQIYQQDINPGQAELIDQLNNKASVATAQPQETAQPDLSRQIEQGRQNYEMSIKERAAKEAAQARARYEASVIEKGASPTATPVPLNYLEVPDKEPPPMFTATPTPEGVRIMPSATPTVEAPAQEVEVRYNPIIRKEDLRPIKLAQGFEMYPAIIQGLISVESSGNPKAISPMGAKGLMQLMPGAVEDFTRATGRSVDRANPTQNIEAGSWYLINEFDKTKNELSKVFTDTGRVNTNPDIRMVLASYNGGFRDIRNAIRAGNYTWEEVLEYIKNVKSEDAFKENSQYPDKVLITAMKALNPNRKSDVALLANLREYGAIDVV